jgi:GMP synthase-like glutamine amidotransferase
VRVNVLRHVPFEGLGSIESWLTRQGAHVHETRLFAQDPLPEPGTFDLLVIMGGPMSVNNEDRFAWLRTEKQTVGDAIAGGIPVLGICLGAQLIASALGARVYPNPVREIGWFPVEGVHASATYRFPAACTVFHWHGETFDLPPGAVRLARSAGCENQAFQVKEHVIGLQFHPEMTMDGARALVENCRDEMTPGPYVQAAEDILRTSPIHWETTNRLMDNILAYLVHPGSDNRSRPMAAAGRRRL